MREKHEHVGLDYALCHQAEQKAMPTPSFIFINMCQTWWINCIVFRFGQLISGEVLAEFVAATYPWNGFSIEKLWEAWSGKSVNNERISQLKGFDTTYLHWWWVC